MNITDLSKQVISILASAKNPEYIINTAKEETEKQIGERIASGFDKKNSIEKSSAWNVIYKEGEWWIEQNKIFKQYRLIGLSTKKTFFSVQKEDKLQVLLSKIIEIGSSKNAIDLKSTMSIYQVVVDEGIETKAGCIKISLSKAKDQFPDSTSICAGFYTIHPCNEKALTPIENYFTNLALDKENECIVLIGKFGAKSVHIIRKENNKKSNETSSDLSIKKVKLDANAGAQLSKELTSEVDFKVEFQGNITNFSADILKKSLWFKNDPHMNALMELLLSSNPPKDWEYVEKNTSTFNFDFNAVANILNIATVDLKNEYEKICNIERHFHVIF